MKEYFIPINMIDKRVSKATYYRWKKNPKFRFRGYYKAPESSEKCPEEDSLKIYYSIKMLSRSIWRLNELDSIHEAWITVMKRWEKGHTHNYHVTMGINKMKDIYKKRKIYEKFTRDLFKEFALVDQSLIEERE